jgi:low temperature requirement protein LtrA
MSRRPWWQTPQLRNDEEIRRQRKVTWLELFFDLFYVVIITRLSHELAQDVSLFGVAQFAMLFLPVWWAWMGITYYNERFETEGLEQRLIFFVFMIPSAGLALFTHHALTEHFAGFIGSYMVARIIILLLWVRAGLHNRSTFWPVARRYAAGFSLALLVYAAAIATDWPWRFLLVPIGLAIDVLTPITTLPLQQKLPRLSATKHSERFGLFTLIVLGVTVSTMVEGIANLEWIDLRLAIFGVLAIALGFGMWWVYFDFVGRRPFKPNIWISYAWAYLHVPLFLGIIAAGAGLLNLVDAPVHRPAFVLTAGAVGVFLMTCCLLELTLRRTDDEPTHVFLSPALKAATGLCAFGLAAAPPGVSPAVLVSYLIALLGIPIAYGAWVWYAQELPPSGSS